MQNDESNKQQPSREERNDSAEETSKHQQSDKFYSHDSNVHTWQASHPVPDNPVPDNATTPANHTKWGEIGDQRHIMATNMERHQMHHYLTHSQHHQQWPSTSGFTGLLKDSYSANNVGLNSMTETSQVNRSSPPYIYYEESPKISQPLSSSSEKQNEEHSSSPQNSREDDDQTTKGQKTRKLSSIFKGVSWHKRDKRWTSRTWSNGKTQHIGSYVYEKVAAIAVDIKLLENGTKVKNIFDFEERSAMLLETYNAAKNGDLVAKKDILTLQINVNREILQQHLKDEPQLEPVNSEMKPNPVYHHGEGTTYAQDDLSIDVQMHSPNSPNSLRKSQSSPFLMGTSMDILLDEGGPPKRKMSISSQQSAVSGRSSLPKRFAANDNLLSLGESAFTPNFMLEGPNRSRGESGIDEDSLARLLDVLNDSSNSGEKSD